MAEKLDMDRLEILLETMEPREIRALHRTELEADPKLDAFLNSFESMDQQLLDLKMLDAPPTMKTAAESAGPMGQPVHLDAPRREPERKRHRSFMPWALPMAAVLVMGLIWIARIPDKNFAPTQPQPTMRDDGMPMDTRSATREAFPSEAMEIEDGSALKSDDSITTPESDVPIPVLESDSSSELGVSTVEAPSEEQPTSPAPRRKEKKSASVYDTKSEKMEEGFENILEQTSSSRPARPEPIMETKSQSDQPASHMRQAQKRDLDSGATDRQDELTKSLPEQEERIALRSVSAEQTAGLQAEPEINEQVYDYRAPTKRGRTASARVMNPQQWWTEFENAFAGTRDLASLFTGDARIIWPLLSPESMNPAQMVGKLESLPGIRFLQPDSNENSVTVAYQRRKEKGTLVFEIRNGLCVEVKPRKASK